jgi:energy-coupling factor transporter ATP-binding protein EcfA2
MKLTRFFVNQYLLLYDLDLRFYRPNRIGTGEYSLDFLVGVNGSGKSTVLRALTLVFANLRAGIYINFDFEVEYLLGKYKVIITQKHQSENGEAVLSMRVWDENAKVDKNAKIYDEPTIDEHFLPHRVVVYTTGNEAEWFRMYSGLTDEAGLIDAPKDLLDDAVQRSIVELPGSIVKLGREAPLQGEPPFWLMQSTRLPAITLCGLLKHLAISPPPLLDVLTSIGLQSVTGFSLRFRLHKKISPFETYEQLEKLSTTHIQQGTDHLLVFDLNHDSELPIRILDAFSNSLDLYRKLDQLQEISQSGEPTLQQINIFVERTAPSTNDEETDFIETPNLFLVDWLSDGEQSFLGRMALLAMLDTEESLILLDEPEVHFNDFWKREIIDLLARMLGDRSNQLLMTTHSMIVVSDLTASQIHLFVKGDDGHAQVIDTLSPTFGADPGEIMNDLLGTGRPGGVYSRNYLDAAIKRGNTNELAELVEIVGPGYWRFRIRARLEELNATPN